MESPRVPEHPQRVYALTTRWSDEDRQGVLNNAAYLTLCEEARHRLCSEAGVLTNNEFPFVLAKANVRWLSPGVGGAEVLVELSTLEIGTTSFTQSYRIKDRDSGVIWAECEARLVAWDPATRRKAPLPEALVRALRGLSAR